MHEAIMPACESPRKSISALEFCTLIVYQVDKVYQYSSKVTGTFMITIALPVPDNQ